ncbi:MAG: methyltransferase domain-containing protein [Chloroflexi bacterium]|nr:methyltransferase domain-containing protein [Chloroflexota bacterium]
MIDLGTGDGRYVLAVALACPDVLAIGVDADAASMAEAARRAARGGRKGGLDNALFVAAAAESLPAELDGIASALTVHFPWGSLLRGLLRAEAGVLSGIARVTRPGAAVTLLLSVTERDHVEGMDTFDGEAIARIDRCYAAHGLALVEARPATVEDMAAAHSSWAKRLGAGGRRPAWLLRFRRCGPAPLDSYPACHAPGESGVLLTGRWQQERRTISSSSRTNDRYCASLAQAVSDEHDSARSGNAACIQRQRAPVLPVQVLP